LRMLSLEDPLPLITIQAREAGGLRIIDINDPANPKERGYFIPKPGDGVAAPLTNDVFKDDRGLLWVTDKERGLDVIEYKN
jgi:hypothetical protein